MLDPAVKGTLNVIDAAAKSSVKRIIYTSSIGTVYMDPKRDPSIIVDESCWSDLDFCKDTKVISHSCLVHLSNTIILLGYRIQRIFI